MPTKKTTKEKSKGGRPPKYNKDVPSEVLRWVKEDCGLKETISIDVKGEHIPHNLLRLPTRAALANHLQITRSTVNEWEQKHSEFSEALEVLDQSGEQMISEYSASNLMNSTIGKLMLHNHGYSDKTDNNNKTEVSGTISMAQVLENLADEIEAESKN